MQRLLPRVMLLSGTCALILTGCEHLMPTSGPDVAKDSCATFRLIQWSKKDTDETIVQVKSHNAAWRALCAVPN